MQPMGRKKNKRNFVDYHPKNGWINWWEDEIVPNKKRERQKIKKELRKMEDR